MKKKTSKLSWFGTGAFTIIGIVYIMPILIVLINLIPQMLDVIQRLSPNDIGRQIANTHTIFAIIAVLVELPFANKIISLAERIIPITQEEIGAAADRKLVYMDNIRVSAIPVAVLLSDAKREISRMGEFSAKALRIYCGLALYDGTWEQEPRILKYFTEKYGLICM